MNEQHGHKGKASEAGCWQSSVALKLMEKAERTPPRQAEARVNARLKEISAPLMGGNKYCFELSSGEFVIIDLQENANGNGQWVVEHLDSTGEFVAGLQLEGGN